MGNPSSNSNNNHVGLEYLKLGFKGFCMGIADLIPGISGGTIAFISGIYEDLIKAIKSFDGMFLRLVVTLRLREAFAHASWKFLGTILIGILCAIFSLSNIISWLLHNKPVLIHAFFFGLIAATVPIIARNVRIWKPVLVSVLLLTAVWMYYLVGLVPVNTPETKWFLFLSGAIAICAMILPGISGAFILVLLGKYQYIIDAVSHHDFVTLSVVALGCLIGILTFVRILSWLFNHHHDVTIAVLTGFVIGSLRKVWPWKETLQTMITSKGKIIPIEQVNILPPAWNAETVIAIALTAAGFILALLLSLPTPKRLVNNHP